MMIIYNEKRIRNKSNNNHIKKEYKNNINKFNTIITEKNYHSYLNTNNKIKKSNSLFISKNLLELQNIAIINNLKKNNKIEIEKNYLNKRPNKAFSYNLQNYCYNYPIPEPLPKKIDIKIKNNSNFSNNNINDSCIKYKKRNSKSNYDDKKILFILSNLGLEDLFCKFKDNFIIYNDLNFLTKDDLKEMNIPIGPRNRIINFIQELKINGINLSFEGLKNFIENYKKKLSGQNLNKKDKKNIEIENKNSSINNEYIKEKNSQNSFVFSSQYYSEKNDNNNFLDKNKNDTKTNISSLSNNLINNNNFNIINSKNIFEDYSSSNNYKKIIVDTKRSKIHSENILTNFSTFSEVKKDNKLNTINNNNYKLNINENNNKNYNNILNYEKKLTNNKRSYSQNNINNIKDKRYYIPQNKKQKYILKTIFSNNYEYEKVPHLYRNYSCFVKYNKYIPDNIKIKKKNIKEKNINNILKKNNIFINNISKSTKNNRMLKNKNESFLINTLSISKNLLNRLYNISKEVEKYQYNYERLKKETKRRNNNVNKILTSDIFSVKHNKNLVKSKNKFISNRNIVYIYDKDF